jgi:hypothetical protein
VGWDLGRKRMNAFGGLVGGLGALGLSVIALLGGIG